MFRLIFAFSLFAPLSPLVGDLHPVTRVKKWMGEENTKKGGVCAKQGILAISTDDGFPITAIVKIERFSRSQGALFFTHTRTPLCRNSRSKPIASLTIWLPQTLRSVSMSGKIKQLSEIEREKQWNQLSRKAQLLFMSSDHMSPLSNPSVLFERKAKLETLFPHSLPLPSNFTGYYLEPHSITFIDENTPPFPVKHIAEQEADAWKTYQIEP